MRTWSHSWLRWAKPLALVTAFGFAACSDDETESTPNPTDTSTGSDTDVSSDTDASSDVDTDTTTDTDLPGEDFVCEGSTPRCEDEQVLWLSLREVVNTDAMTEEGTTAGEFTTYIDATGGGMNPTKSYIYARFTDEGLARVEVSDDASFASSEWDIAFRRYYIRLNSGVSGPSCVVGARVAGNPTFEEVTEVPAGLPLRTEDYIGEDCSEDGQAVDDLGGPLTVLSSFWSYQSCVRMTNYVYVVRTSTGRHVKFTVLSYYPAENQERCNTTGSITTPSGAGALRVRWAFLD